MTLWDQLYASAYAYFRLTQHLDAEEAAKKACVFADEGKKARVLVMPYHELPKGPRRF